MNINNIFIFLKNKKDQPFFKKFNEYLEDIDLLLISGKRKVILVLITMLCAAFLEAASTYLISPLIEAVGESSNSVNSNQSGLFYILILAILVTTLTAFARIYNLKKVTFFSAYLANQIFHKALSNSITSDYEKSSEENTSDMSSVLSNQLNVTSGGLLNYLLLISTLIVVFFQLSAVIYIGGLEALGLIFLGILVYIVVYLWNRDLLLRNSGSYEKSTRLLMKQIVDSIKLKYEYKTRNLTERVLLEAKKNDFISRRAQASNIYLTSAPRFTVEAFIIIGICIVIFFSSLNAGDSAFKIFGKLGVIALSGQKILPSLQTIYSSLAAIKGAKESIKAIKKQLKPNKIYQTKYDFKYISNIEKLIFKNIDFKYNSANKNILNNFSLEINLTGMKVFKGESGCGKTTLLRMICGEIFPNNGKLLAETKGKKIRGYYGKDYMPRIGYVPQKIYLLDDTLERNITLDNEKFDYDKLKNILKIVCLDNFINNKNINLSFGQEGSQLSGGQIQRIGIARSLWLKPEILILDEATNALDPNTEEKLIKNLIESKLIKCLLMIKHGEVNTKNSFDIINL